MHDLNFLIDVDNTLLDNDRLKGDMDAALERELGADATAEFWRIYEEIRVDEQYVDFPAALKEFAHDQSALAERASAVVDGVEFPSYVYPGAFDALAHLDTIGLAVILSDGDQVFQRRKIEESGIGAAVGDRVILTVHKQDEMQRAFDTYPAKHYALIDDKTSIIAAIGRAYPELITTVLVRQGKYASIEAEPGPDLAVDRIGDLVSVPEAEFHHTPDRLNG
jgi:FMN phosphatase YigB (HAD superfamily)